MVAALLTSLLAPALFLLCGICIQRAFGVRLVRWPWGNLGLSYLLGLATIALLLWTASFLGGIPLDRRWIGGMTLGLLGLGLARRPASPFQPSDLFSRPRLHLPGLALALLLGVITLALLVHAAANPVHDFDGRMTWGTAAKFIASDQSALPLALVDRHAYIQHPQYPILMPLAQVFVSTVTGRSLEERLVRQIYVLFLPAALLAVWPYLRRHSGATAGTLAIALVFLSPIILWQVDVGAAGTYSDFPLAAFLGLGLFVAADARTRFSWRRGALCGILLAGAVGSKNEGLVLVGVLLACVWSDGWITLRKMRVAGSRVPRGSIALSVLVVLFAIQVRSWRSFIPNRNDESYLSKLDPSTLLSRVVERGGEVLMEIARQLANTSGWSLSLVALALLLLVVRRGSSSRLERFCWALVIAQAALAFTAYIHLPNVDKVGSTLNRLLLQVSIPIVVLIACRLQTLLAECARGSAVRTVRDREVDPARTGRAGENRR